MMQRKVEAWQVGAQNQDETPHRIRKLASHVTRPPFVPTIHETRTSAEPSSVGEPFVVGHEAISQHEIFYCMH